MTRKHVLALALALLVGGALADSASTPQEMDLVITEAHAELCDHDFSKAHGTLRIQEMNNGTTQVTVTVRGCVPNHLYTAWLRLDASTPSPITGAPATALAGTGDIDTILANGGTDSDAGANVFYTNAAGNATLHVTLDFLLGDGVYPFSAYDGALSDAYIGSEPFTVRVSSHCSTGTQGGLVPGPNEPTFDITLD